MAEKENLFNALMKVIERMSCKENATLEEMEALAKVAEVAALILIN